MRLKSGKKMFSVAVWLGRFLCLLEALVEDTRVALQVGRKYFGPFFFFVQICAQILMCQFVVQICAQQNNCCAQICFTCVFGTHNVINALGQMWSLMQLNRHKIAVFEKKYSS